MSKESALGSADPVAHDGDAVIPPSAQVLVVDDDAPVRSALGRLLGSCGYAVTTFHNAESLLAQHDPHAYGCIILDVAMPGRDGLAVQQALEQRGNQMPIIFLSGQADVPMCAQAMRRGAFDFLTKPVDEAVLLAAVARALQRDAELLSAWAEREATESRLATLTAREREVLIQVIAGRLNKQIAADLGTAEKTIKVHRARGMQKMRVRSVAELVRIMERTHPQTPGRAA
jgi:FixJ family two-component response regulator